MASLASALSASSASVGCCGVPLFRSKPAVHVPLLVMGNPFLEITLTSTAATSAFEQKYKMRPGEDPPVVATGALVTDARRQPGVCFKPGGTAHRTGQEVARRLADDNPAACAVYGGVGSDMAGRILRDQTEEQGLVSCYHQVVGPTSVRVTSRSMDGRSIAVCGSGSGPPPDGALPDGLLLKTRSVYTTGFFLLACPNEVMRVATHCTVTGKFFALRICADFVPLTCYAHLNAVMPHVDLLVCSPDELEVIGTSWRLRGLVDEMSPGGRTGALAATAQAMPRAPGKTKKPRIVAVTGEAGQPGMVVHEGGQMVPWPWKSETGEDANADVMTGQLLAGLIHGESLVNAATGEW